MLRCADGLLYVGSARDLDQRLHQHANGRIGFTSRRKPVELVWQLECELQEAYDLERRIHRWSRAKKHALIEGKYDLLSTLASRAWANRQGRAGDPPGAEAR
jgi:putative endonuclease